VFDPETGTPLEIELDSEIDELRPYGSGRYRLDAIDGNGKLIPGVTAYVEVPTEDSAKQKETESPETAATLRELTQLLRESMQTNCRALEAMATAFGPVRPAAAQPQQPVYVMSPTQASDEKPADVMTKIMEFLPAVRGFMQMLPMFVQMFKGAAAGSAAPDAGAAAAAAAAAATPPNGVMS
jgi:hypothetical protein